MTRATPEWIGKSDDDRAPPRVRLRIFERHGGVCHLSGRKIAAGEPWDLDHVIALVNGGENRESNLAPALRDKHREKTARDVAEKSAIRDAQMKHLGIERASTPILSRGFQPTAKSNRRARKAAEREHLQSIAKLPANGLGVRHV